MLCDQTKQNSLYSTLAYNYCSFWKLILWITQTICKQKELNGQEETELFYQQFNILYPFKLRAYSKTHVLELLNNYSIITNMNHGFF